MVHTQRGWRRPDSSHLPGIANKDSLLGPIRRRHDNVLLFVPPEPGRGRLPVGNYGRTAPPLETRPLGDLPPKRVEGNERDRDRNLRGRNAGWFGLSLRGSYWS